MTIKMSTYHAGCFGQSAMEDVTVESRRGLVAMVPATRCHEHFSSLVTDVTTPLAARHLVMRKP